MNNLSIQEDEVDLREILKTFIKRKMTIFIVTFVTTISAMIYTWFIPPIYSGNVLIEIGEVVNINQVTKDEKQTYFYYLDNMNNLKEITSQFTGLNVTIPSSTSNLLYISMESNNISKIKYTLGKAVQFIINRHQKKIKLYQNNNSKIRMTQVIGKINISNEPIKPKKQLIINIGFVSGVMLGIFLAFFLEFIGARRNR